MIYTGHYLKEKKKKVIGLMNGEIGIKIMTEYFGLRAKTHSHLTYINDENKIKKHKKCITKRKLKFEYHKNSLKATQFENIINQLEKKKRNGRR